MMSGVAAAFDRTSRSPTGPDRPASNVARLRLVVRLYVDRRRRSLLGRSVRRVGRQSAGDSCRDTARCECAVGGHSYREGVCRQRGPFVEIAPLRWQQPELVPLLKCRRPEVFVAGSASARSTATLATTAHCRTPACAGSKSASRASALRAPRSLGASVLMLCHVDPRMLTDAHLPTHAQIGKRRCHLRYTGHGQGPRCIALRVENLLLVAKLAGAGL